MNQEITILRITLGANIGVSRWESLEFQRFHSTAEKRRCALFWSITRHNSASFDPIRPKIQSNWIAMQSLAPKWFSLHHDLPASLESKVSPESTT